MYEKIDEKDLTIYRFLVENSDRNINYVVECPQTKEALIIDPLDNDTIENIINDNNLIPKMVINTHAHPDHIAGNSYFLEKYGIKLRAHDICKKIFDYDFDNIFENDILSFGKLSAKILHTPGHCPEHISIIINDYILCGDTIFSCGVGNVKFRGDVSMLFRTIQHKMKNLPETFKLLPGHDYFENNIGFLKSILLKGTDFYNEVDKLLSQNDKNILSPIKNIDFEKKYNPFFRIDEFSFMDLIKENEKFSGLNMEERFKELREMRDQW